MYTTADNLVLPVKKSDVVSLGHVLRECLLLLWRVQLNDDMLPRVFQLAQSLQLQLLLRSITQSTEHETHRDCIILLQTAFNSLDSVFGDKGTIIGNVCSSESALQEFRNTLASLNHALNVVPQHVVAFGDSIGASVVAIFELLVKDSVFDALDKGTFLGRLVTEMREEMTKVVQSRNGHDDTKECDSASTAALCLALDNEKNARAAADVKASMLQRECQHLKDELARSVESAAAALNCSETQLQLMTAQLVVLQVSFCRPALYLCPKIDTVTSQAANDNLLEDVQAKVFKISETLTETLYLPFFAGSRFEQTSAASKSTSTSIITRTCGQGYSGL